MQELKENRTLPTITESPRFTAGGREFCLRYGFTADYLLEKWGLNLGGADFVELAAAMAGSFDSDGVWHSAGFKKPIELAELIEREDMPRLREAVNKAVNFRFPTLQVTGPTQPAGEAKTDPRTSEAPANDSSNSGPSPQVQMASESPKNDSGV